MIRFIILAAIVYLAWHFYNWKVAVGVIAAYVAFILVVNLASMLTRGINAGGQRGRSTKLVGQRLSDEEKAHFATSQDHERAMIDHKAQFDPELRKTRGT